MRNSQRVPSLLVGAGVILSWLAAPAAVRGEDKTIPTESTNPLVIKDALHLVGLGDTKRNTRGLLTLSRDGVKFETPNSSAVVSAAVLAHFAVDHDTRGLATGKGALALSALPYGSGRALGMVRRGVGVMTVEYRDDRQGLHEAVILIPEASASEVAASLTSLNVKEFPALPVQSKT